MGRLSQPILIAFTLLLIMSCQRLLISGSHPGFHSATQQLASAECRVVQHPMGETCVPVEPKRVVALDPGFILDPLLSLGIKPIGTTADFWRGTTYWWGLSPETVEGIEIVGQPNQPSLEKLLMIKPDLILGLTDAEAYYAQLSAISPTVLIDSSEMLRHSFKRHWRVIAQIIRKEVKAEKLISQYHQKIEILKAKLKGRLAGKNVSVIWYTDDNFWAPTPNATFFQVLKDINVSISPAFLEKNSSLIPTSGIPFSTEVISRYDADILFICNPNRQSRAFLLKNPLISSLKAAQEKQLYVIECLPWGTNGPSAINKLIDELSQYLLKAAINVEENQANRLKAFVQR
ncbi:MAG: ABC transporter substrate-binding protein [Nodosilinea sp.]